MVEYADGLALQNWITETRGAHEGGDALLLLEHPPVLTLGRAAREANILAPEAVLQAAGVEVHETSRGGDVTYHGPGQLVAYPLLYLPPGQQDVRKYVTRLEECLIRTLADFHILAERSPGRPGVWVTRDGRPRKIAALGVHLARWQTRHGIALNIAPDLSHFEFIVPCGIHDAGVTSMAQEMGAPPPFDEVANRFAHHFAEVFARTLVAPPPPRLCVATVLVQGSDVLLLKRVPERGGFWQPVTGRPQPEESFPDAARRETEEETGFRLELQPLGRPRDFLWPGGVGVGRQQAYGGRAPSREVRISDEHEAYAWVPKEEAMARVPHPSLRRAIRDALS